MARSSRLNKSLNFEKSLGDLESIIEKMEGDQLTLEDALKHFETGVTLSKLCQATLAEAEQKVSLLIEKANQDIDFSPLPAAE
jgi:exodeoxyribonuclease VII small subunit